MDPVATFSAMDPEGEMIVWSLDGDDAADFDITGGVLSFKQALPASRRRRTGDSEEAGGADNSYEVDVVATEVRAPGSLEIAQDAFIIGHRERQEHRGGPLADAQPSPGAARRGIDCRQP